ncbi:acyl-CoA dehydrogenase family protein [soil metagenome]
MGLSAKEVEGDMKLDELPLAEIRAGAADVDRGRRFPTAAMAALRRGGWLALAVPAAYGGPGGTAPEIARAVEKVAAACASTGIVYTMHLTATRTLLAGTDGEQDGMKAETLRAIAAGRHLSTLAYSERGTRSHFWAQLSRAVAHDGGVLLTADKTWATSAGNVDSYIVATGAVCGDGPLITELYLVPATSAGIQVRGAFDGLGLRGNASSPVRFHDVFVASGQRLGAPASGFGLMLTATLPIFVVCSAAVSVGIAEAAIEAAAAHLTATRLEHLATTLAQMPGSRSRLAEARIRHLQARALLHQVAGQVESGSAEAQEGVLALKAAAAEMAIAVTDETMRACGGAAFTSHLPLERHFRDARAATVMAPTTDILRDLLGKALTGQELFA